MSTNTKVVGDNAYGFPVRKLSDVPPGSYFAQALYDTDTTYSYINAPGNWHSRVVPVTIPASGSFSLPLTLEKQIEGDKLPKDTASVKYIRLQRLLKILFYINLITVLKGQK